MHMVITTFIHMAGYWAVSTAANLIYKQALHEAALKETEVADPTAVPAMLAAVHPFQLAFNVISLQKVSLLSVVACCQR